MTETIAWWQKKKVAPAVRSLTGPFSLHAHAAPLHHPPTPASFRSSLRGICSLPTRVAPSQSAHTRMYTYLRACITTTQAHTTHTQRTHSQAAQQQHSNKSAVLVKMSHRLQLRLRQAKQGFSTVASRCLPFCRSRKFIKDREIRQSQPSGMYLSTSAPSTGFMPHSMAPRVNTEQAHKVSFAHLHFCVPYVPVYQCCP